MTEPSKPRRWGRIIGAGAGLAVLVLAVFALVQGGGDSGSGPLDAIAAAAEKTENEPGGRAVMHGIVSSPGQSDSIAMTGQMVYDAGERGRGVVTVPASETSRPVKVDFIADGAVMYMHSTQFGSLPGGGEWMKVDFSSGEEEGAPVPVSDPKGELALLKGMEDVEKLGREDVRGVPTTHYAGTIGSAEDDSSLPLEVWIDADGLVRRMRIAQPQDGGESPSIDMRIDFLDLGIEPEIDLPDPGDVYDATDLATSG